MQRLEGLQISSGACVCNARRFDESVFREGIQGAVERALAITGRRSAVARP